MQSLLDQVNILIIADPYKSRPNYKVARVKAAAGKKPFSYDMTPNTPEPSMDWRDVNSHKKSLKPTKGMLPAIIMDTFFFILTGIE